MAAPASRIRHVAELPQIPGNSGPPQIPGGADYAAATQRRTGQAPRDPGTPASDPGRRPRRRGRGRLRGVQIAAVAIIALVGLARAGREERADQSSVVTKLPVIGGERGGTERAPTVPTATVYRAARGAVEGHRRTIIELGVRRGRIRWIAATRIPTTCSDGTSSSGLLLYDDEGTPSGGGRTLRYRTDAVQLTFRPGERRGTLRYERQGLEARCASPTLRFRATPAAEPLLAQRLLAADRAAADRFR